ncbi:hypothetical protein K402DRAFT_85263 [Aulographum hederae CBS 113979]|uniref:Uncharacterized protein n=1 Tax=Aulographum hederae CBS 113979 TaxID=1176131 RepID=A0A6G1H0D3_9PEZI|nr:hypothetical protein K402DRAFT_85263 [Aulographum hederae CBS 113979]
MQEAQLRLFTHLTGLFSVCFGSAREWAFSGALLGVFLFLIGRGGIRDTKSALFQFSFSPLSFQALCLVRNFIRFPPK